MFAQILPPTICIDPGHPSEVGRGAKGRHSTEIGVAWKVAGDLAQTLRRDGYRVILTKQREEQFVRNKDRAETANRAGAALMVRLHCDDAQGTGFGVYYPSRAGTSGGVTGPSQSVLASSARAARQFHDAMATSLMGELADRGLMSDLRTAVGGRQGALTGSIFSRVPVLLVEMVVLTNPRDEQLILSPKGETSMVRALARGVEAAIPSKDGPKRSKVSATNYAVH